MPSSPADPHVHSASPSRAWLAVLALALAAFVFNTTEFVPVGLLSAMGESFDMRAERVGLMLTVYAWAVALASLPLMLVTRRMERRGLLAGLFALFVVSHGVCALAPNFSVLLLGRLGIAAAHAVFWSITASLVVRVAPAGRKAQALGLLAGGTSLAMVLGIPLGRAMGQWLGWRVTFAGIGAVALLVLLLLWWLLPRLPSERSGSLRSLPLLLGRPALVSVYVLLVAGVTAHFMAYSYLEPFMQRVAGLDGPAITQMLLLFGAAGLVGSALFSWQGLRHPAAFLLCALAALVLCLGLLRPAAAQPWALAALLGLWGAVFLCFALAMQARVLGLAADAGDVAMALFSGLFNVGIGAGALLGSGVIGRWGVAHVGWPAGILAGLTLLGAGAALRRWRSAFAQGRLVD
ncbi:sugar transporter [Vandammella animalimorsus]|uniref:sugar transporter n=1 Tax=Vandammella animalimorsus TaxID=2029117 RepID=UPI0031B9C8C4